MLRSDRQFVRGLSLFAAILWLLPGLAGAQPADDGGTPAEAEAEGARESTVQVTEQRELANGVQLVTQSLPGVESTAIIVMARTGSDHDPNNAPGLSLLLSRLGLTAATSREEPREWTQLDRAYPQGWSSQTGHNNLTFGIVVPSGEVADHLPKLAARAQGIAPTDAGILEAIEKIEEEMIDRFEIKRPLIPISWLITKTFRHPGDPRGISPERLIRLSGEKIAREWQARMNPTNLTVILCGSVHEEMVVAAEESFSSLSAIEETPTKRSVKPVGKDERRKVQVPVLPADRPHVVVAYYAPPITDADHPGFLAVARVFMRAAARMPGATARIAFQYDPMLDDRAAYMTPHTVFYRAGPGQALGYWSAKIRNQSFSRSDGQRVLAQIGWEFGDPIIPEVMDRVQRDTRVLYSIAFATAFRSLHGTDAFWEDYRSRLARLSARELNRIRETYFYPENCALFLLEEDAEDALHRRGSTRPRNR